MSLQLGDADLPLYFGACLVKGLLEGSHASWRWMTEQRDKMSLPWIRPHEQIKLGGGSSRWSQYRRICNVANGQGFFTVGPAWQLGLYVC